MQVFMVLACVSMAYGRPEPPVGYSYSAPTRHSSPSSNYGAPSGGRILLGHSSGVSSLSHSSGSFGDKHYSGRHLTDHGHFSGGISAGSSSFGGDSGLGSSYSGGYVSAPIIQKHIYVHVPPPEPQEHRAVHIPAVAPPQKHYKIIFIKAPAPPAPTAPIIPIQPQNEEKTLVYVLVKKPDEQPDIIIPTPAPTQPSKPEVYFIKYQTQKESGGSSAGAAISDAIGGADLSAALGSSGSGEHAGVESTDFGASGGDDTGSDAGNSSSGATSTQYGPPGHVAGPLH